MFIKRRMIILLLPIMMLIFFIIAFFRYYTLWGISSYESTFSRSDGMISLLYPAGRLDDAKDAQILRQEPVYFEARAPRNLAKVSGQMRFQPSNVDVVELGITKTPGEYEMVGVYHETLERLLRNQDWNVTKVNDGLFFQRKAAIQFSSLEDFLRERSGWEDTAVYRYELDDRSFPLDERTYRAKTALNLLGSHELVVGGTERISGVLQLESPQAGTLRLTLAEKGKDIDEKAFDLVPGRNFAHFDFGQGRGKRFLSIRVGDDVILRFLMINSRYWGVTRNIRANGDGDQTIYCNEPEIQVMSRDPDGGSLRTGEETQRLEWQRFIGVSLTARSRVFTMQVRGSADIAFRGLCFLSEESVFRSGPSLLYGRDLNSLDGIQYIIARYHPVTYRNGFVVSNFEFWTPPRIDQTMRFIISVPGFQAQENQMLRLKGVTVTHHALPLHQWIFKKVSAFSGAPLP